MKWRTDLPDDWDAVPDDPPVADRGLEHARVGDTFVVRERDGPGFVAAERPADCVDAGSAASWADHASDDSPSGDPSDAHESDSGSGR